MQSVLLGGLKVFLVNDGGKPLSAPGGRARFYRAGTSTPETVYSDIDLTLADALGTVVYTNELGYLPAIWLKTDRLYKVRVEQKIADDPETWSLLWEVDNVGFLDSGSQGLGEVTLSVNSISELKQVNHDDHGAVLVSGYFTAGDWGEPSMFVWDEECTKTPDDGAYVLPSDQQQTSAGRWVQVFDGDILDVRKFGALPDMSDNSDVTSKVIHAINYSQNNSTRTRPLTVGFVAPGRYDFAGNFDFTLYYFIDLQDNSRHDLKWYIGKDVVFNNILETAITITLSRNTVCLATEALVSGLVTLNVQGGGSIQVDPVWWGSRDCSVSNCYVKCSSVTTNRKILNSCMIESNGMLGGRVALEYCDVWEGMFSSDFSYDISHLSVTGCKVHPIEEWSSVEHWFFVKRINKDAIFDFGGRGSVNMSWSWPSSYPQTIQILNASSLTLTITGSLDGIYLRDCYNLIISVPSGADVIAFGCRINGGLNGVSGNVSMDGCDIESVVRTSGTITANGCRLGMSGGIYGNSVNVSNCSGTPGSIVGEEGSNAIGIYSNSNLYKISAINPFIYGCRVYQMNHSVPVASTEWTSTIKDSAIDSLVLTNTSAQVPRFVWSNSSITITSFTKYVPTDGYFVQWTLDDCTVRGPGGTKFKRNFNLAMHSGNRKFISTSGDVSAVLLVGWVVSGLLTFEEFPSSPSGNTGLPDSGNPLLKFGYACNVVGVGRREATSSTSYGKEGFFANGAHINTSAIIAKLDDQLCLCLYKRDYSFDTTGYEATASVELEV